MRRIILSLLVIAGAGAVIASGATGAFFSDTETSVGNTLTAGAIDLLIDNESYYNGVVSENTSWELRNLTIEKFFDFSDLKPGDFGEDTISLHVDTNDAFLCANVTLTSNDDNGLNEPEALVDETDGAGNGELAGEVNFIWWADDGDNVLEDDENVLNSGNMSSLGVGNSMPLVLADSQTNIWNENQTGGPVTGGETYYIGKAWCFGALTQVPLAQDTLGAESPRTPANSTGGISCDSTNLGNETQTDSLTANVSFEAVQARHNGSFMCTRPQVACEAGEQYADSVVLADQGRRKDGSLVLVDRRNPATALGAPQTTGTPSDPSVLPNSFFSLGFGVSTTSSRSLTLAFNNNIIIDGTGADVRVYEVTGGVYPDEHVKVEASQNGTVWVTIAPDAIRDASIDLNGSGLSWAKYIRLTDINSTAPFTNDADGYDVDAVEALNCAKPLVF